MRVGFLIAGVFSRLSRLYPLDFNLEIIITFFPGRSTSVIIPNRPSPSDPRRDPLLLGKEGHPRVRDAVEEAAVLLGRGPPVRLRRRERPAGVNRVITPRLLPVGRQERCRRYRERQQGVLERKEGLGDRLGRRRPFG